MGVEKKVIRLLYLLFMRMRKEKWLITFQENITDVMFQTKLEFDYLELGKFIKELIYEKGYHLINITKVYD